MGPVLNVILFHIMSLEIKFTLPLSLPQPRITVVLWSLKNTKI